MAAPRKDFDAAVRIYADGGSIADAAAHYGVTRQAMHTILKRRGVAMRPRERRGAENHFHRGGAARNAFFVAAKEKRRGLVAQPCETCGLPPMLVNGRERIHAHHDDYNFLLVVRWLCAPCHHAWHKHNKPIPRRADWVPTPKREICAMGGRAPRARKRQ